MVGKIPAALKNIHYLLMILLMLAAAFMGARLVTRIVKLATQNLVPDPKEGAELYVGFTLASLILIGCGIALWFRFRSRKAS